MISTCKNDPFPGVLDDSVTRERDAAACAVGIENHPLCDVFDIKIPDSRISGGSSSTVDRNAVGRSAIDDGGCADDGYPIERQVVPRNIKRASLCAIVGIGDVGDT